MHRVLYSLDYINLNAVIFEQVMYVWYIELCFLYFLTDRLSVE